MNTDRIEEIQKETAHPDSVSVQQALLKVWNECEQQKVVNKNDLLPLVSFNAVEVLDLLTKLLEGNMCSHEGDRLINQLLKSKT